MSRVSIPPEPSASAVIERASPGSPSLHGPHCPEDSLARYRVIRATSPSGQVPGPSGITTPAPSAPPAASRPARDTGTSSANSPGNHIP